MNLFSYLMIFLFGTLCGGSLIWYRYKKALLVSKRDLLQLQTEIEAERLKNARISTSLTERASIIEKQEKELTALRNQYADLQKEQYLFIAEKKDLEIRLAHTTKESEERHKKALLEFENLSQKILDAKTKSFHDTSLKSLKTLLDPLNADVKQFHENIQKKYEADLKDRSAIKEEIRGIIKTGNDLKSSSDSLVNVLRTDSKTRGKWGELVLERVLENSGLRNGYEYTSQMNFINEDGDRRLRPDITIHLSNQKSVFIDAKVTLTYYDDFINAPTESDKLIALNQLIESFSSEIKKLSSKEYHTAQGVDTLDSILMFVPIESVFALVSEIYEERHQKSLFEYAWFHNIIIVSPNTLMPILKTIDYFWKIEHQNKNAQQIADQATALYKKFVLFHEKFQLVKSGIEKSLKHFDDADKSLRTGNGNIMRRLDNIRGLLKIKREIPDEYLIDDVLINDTADTSATITHLTEEPICP